MSLLFRIRLGNHNYAAHYFVKCLLRHRIGTRCTLSLERWVDGDITRTHRCSTSDWDTSPVLLEKCTILPQLLAELPLGHSNNLLEMIHHKLAWPALAPLLRPPRLQARTHGYTLSAFTKPGMSMQGSRYGIQHNGKVGYRWGILELKQTEKTDGTVYDATSVQGPY